MKRSSYHRRGRRVYGWDHLKFLGAALILMVVLDRFVIEGRIHPDREAGQQQAAAAIPPPAQEEAQIAVAVPDIAVPADMLPVERREVFGPEKPAIAPVPPWKKYAAAYHAAPGQPRIAVVIDDLGMNRVLSQEVVAMPGPLTLAFLPYAPAIAPLAAQGRENGHEIIIHMPMEPMDSDLDMGTIYLSTEQTPEEFHAMLEKGLSALSGYTGVNNHMGSRLTQDAKAMRLLMEELRRRGLLFLDSRTIAASVGAETAALYGVPNASRDVFLDDDPSAEGVRAALEKTEAVARAHGVAIAIGHPKAETVAALRDWLPGLAEKGFALVPVSAVVGVQSGDVAAASFGPPDLRGR